VLGAKLALLAAWAALVLLFFAASGRQVMETGDGVRREPFRSFFVGLTGVVCLLLTGLFFSAFAGGVIGVPLLVLVVLLAMVLKLWGMVAVFYASYIGYFTLPAVGPRFTVSDASVNEIRAVDEALIAMTE